MLPGHLLAALLAPALLAVSPPAGAPSVPPTSPIRFTFAAGVAAMPPHRAGDDWNDARVLLLTPGSSALALPAERLSSASFGLEVPPLARETAYAAILTWQPRQLGWHLGQSLDANPDGHLGGFPGARLGVCLDQQTAVLTTGATESVAGCTPGQLLRFGPHGRTRVPQGYATAFRTGSDIGEPTHAALLATASSTVAGTPVSDTLTLTDDYGNPATATVNVSPSGSASASITNTAPGQDQITVRDDTAQTVTVTVSVSGPYPQQDDHTLTWTVPVGPAAATSVSLSLPSSATLPLTVDSIDVGASAHDAYGNNVPLTPGNLTLDGLGLASADPTAHGTLFDLTLPSSAASAGLTVVSGSARATSSLTVVAVPVPAAAAATPTLAMLGSTQGLTPNSAGLSFTSSAAADLTPSTAREFSTQLTFAQLSAAGPSPTLTFQGSGDTATLTADRLSLTSGATATAVDSAALGQPGLAVSWWCVGGTCGVAAPDTPALLLPGAGSSTPAWSAADLSGTFSQFSTAWQPAMTTSPPQTFSSDNHWPAQTVTNVSLGQSAPIEFAITKPIGHVDILVNTSSGVNIWQEALSSGTYATPVLPTGTYTVELLWGWSYSSVTISPGIS